MVLNHVYKPGDEPKPCETLLWLVPNENFWSEKRQGPASNYYKKDPFSAFIERMQGVDDIRKMAKSWGWNTCGIVRLKYEEVRAAGFKAVVKPEKGIDAHVDVSPIKPADGTPLSRGDLSTLANKLVDISEVVAAWGTIV